MIDQAFVEWLVSRKDELELTSVEILLYQLTALTRLHRCKHFYWEYPVLKKNDSYLTNYGYPIGSIVWYVLDGEKI